MMDSYYDIKWLDLNSWSKNFDRRTLSILQIECSDSDCQRILDLLDSDDRNAASERVRGKTLGAKPNAKMPEHKTIVVNKKLAPNRNLDADMFDDYQNLDDDHDDDELLPIPKTNPGFKRTAPGLGNDFHDVEPVTKTKTFSKPSATMSFADYLKERNIGKNVPATTTKTPVKSTATSGGPKKTPISPEEFKQKLVFQAIYGRYKPYKKNKEWSFDGFVLIKPEAIVLYKCSGTIEGRTDRFGDNVPRFFSSGTRLIIGSWECELYDQLNDVTEFERGTYFAPDEIDA